MTILMSKFHTRDQLGELLSGSIRPITVAEIGTHRGDYARQILARWNIGQLFCVDPWSVPPGYEEQAKTLWGNGTRDDDYAAAMKVLGKHPEKATAMRMLSHQAVKHFGNESLDLVYLDGDHSKAAVTEDLANWYGKIRIGGVMSGHDFVHPDEPDGGWGKEIQAPVLEFAASVGADVYVIVENGRMPWSYYFFKTKP